MRDITNTRMMWLKGILFLILGIASAILLLVEFPHWRTAVLIVVAVWAFCRAYYFAFYVIEHYVDPGFHFSGLGSFVRYWIRKNSANKPRRETR